MRTKNDTKKMLAHFKPHEQVVLTQLITLSLTGELCDITFVHRKPILDVFVSRELGTLFTADKSVTKKIKLISQIELSNGERIWLKRISMVIMMPKEGFSERDLQAVDIGRAEQLIWEDKKTIRDLVRDSYCCDTADEDKYIRRFLASRDYEERIYAKYSD
jgi:hypothetical protein